jgi:hypothetical protein
MTHHFSSQSEIGYIEKITGLFRAGIVRITDTTHIETAADGIFDQRYGTTEILGHL